MSIASSFLASAPLPMLSVCPQSNPALMTFSERTIKDGNLLLSQLSFFALYLYFFSAPQFLLLPDVNEIFDTFSSGAYFSEFCAHASTVSSYIPSIQQEPHISSFSIYYVFFVPPTTKRCYRPENVVRSRYN